MWIVCVCTNFIGIDFAMIVLSQNINPKYYNKSLAWAFVNEKVKTEAYEINVHLQKFVSTYVPLWCEKAISSIMCSE